MNRLASTDLLASVQWTERPGQTPRLLDLGLGQRVTFGSCSCGGCGLGIAAPAFGRAAGAITPRSHHWTADNLSRTTVLLIADLEDPQQLIRVPPGRTEVVVPFELATVSAAGVELRSLLTVFGPEPTGRQAGWHACPSDLAAGPAGPLDPAALYYAVLETLCQPRRAAAGSPLPTSADIARDLGRQGIRMTERAVDHHIDYLIRRLAVRPADEPALRRNWKKEALVAEALGRGLLATPARPPVRVA